MNGQQIGYVRVSSDGQNTDRQLDGLKLDRIFTDKITGSVKDRPQLDACILYIRSGDTLHIHSIDRLARDLRHLQELLSLLITKGVTVQFHTEKLIFNGSDNAMNTLLFQIMGAFAQFERSMIRSRQREGIDKAKAKGKHCGRPTIDYKRRDEAIELCKKGYNISQISREMKLSRGSITKLLS
jgi:DNA invertase Pin-like site-specific DNA recombinase